MNNKCVSKILLTYCLLMISGLCYAQTASFSGTVSDKNGTPVIGAGVSLDQGRYSSTTDSSGNFLFENLPAKSLEIEIFAFGFHVLNSTHKLNQGLNQKNFTLSNLEKSLEEVQVHGKKINVFGISRLEDVDGFGIYSGKKNEVVELEDMTVNLSTNNARQVYAKITGLNIWESDGAGIQLGIGGRGLNPDRTSNFNTRQNGYDISADPLGYPESYYTPPAEALDRIEIVRGASSLQYGTQFGGMVNFRFKKGPIDRKIRAITRQTFGSWNFWGSFNSIGGTVANGKLNYYAYYHHKQGDGYRPNSQFDFHNAFASLEYRLSPKSTINLEFTKMQYLAQQAGGLTDRLFEDDPRQSLRERNWFTIDWNLLALNFTQQLSDKTVLNIRNSGLVSTRKSVGNLAAVNVADLGGNRTLIDGQFQYFTNEIRVIRTYKINNRDQVLLIGSRLYSGLTTTRQGDGSAGSGPDFNFINPDNLENSDYDFPNRNIALFAEHIFRLSSRLKITPGIRFEYIDTRTEGYFKQQVFNLAGDLISETRNEESERRSRQFVLFGLGASYMLNTETEVYGNFSQNYRAINFSDLRIVNPNFVIDPDIEDESGYTADLGVKYNKNSEFFLETTVFHLRYNGKIGQILRADQPPLFNDYRFRGNISDASVYGI
jgi:Fe(3+) dicitrate transport protein